MVNVVIYIYLYTRDCETLNTIALMLRTPGYAKGVRTLRCEHKRVHYNVYIHLMCEVVMQNLLMHVYIELKVSSAWIECFAESASVIQC